MACMSRAGREPGFKKQNQDNCFAFEKYITNEQSLFGAFDGHGPNGMLLTPEAQLVVPQLWHPLSHQPIHTVVFLCSSNLLDTVCASVDSHTSFPLPVANASLL